MRLAGWLRGDLETNDGASKDWSSGYEGVYGGAAGSFKAVPDSRHELRVVALTPDMLLQLSRNRVGCMLVVARMRKWGF